MLFSNYCKKSLSFQCVDVVILIYLFEVEK